MKILVQKIGDSQGVLIPEPVLAQAGIELGEVDLAVVDDAIVIRKTPRPVRVGWAEASKRIADAGADGLEWPECGNEADRSLEW
ncbi:AbrB/MazE/SpoVT family DNA-binding domain-containing protein [Rugamonas sp. DEMB1]|jgi:antitoxin MazE|uniref:AbrB/MazE/SpoVT family DNA-binding domain-containing protein n=1 Tax=Rugamonas sp. DEMB1 TaxID=3039386 RepID=UPI0024497871|nr:AbrB/MazE/SpoVT family DNA-binding domain-containing protein [Rugamonas sp. DEMB1]WGG50889.1 AbrB/MazE/SpoVT family DNA-binding domain-containing protein [Rugamonas sp. DEMB1]